MVAQQRLPPSTAPHTPIRPPTDASRRRANPALGRKVLVCAGGVRRVARRAVPQPDGLVIRAGRDRLGVGTPRQAGHAGHVADERVHVCARLCVPDPGGAVRGGRGDPSPVGGDAHLGDGALVAAQLEAGLEVGAEGLVDAGAGAGTGTVAGGGC